MLVVDDSPQIRRLVRLSAEIRGHHVVEAGDGVTGWQLAAVERPDVVILDVMMPGPSGLDICRALRTDQRLAGIPIIILTGSDPAGMEAGARAAGASAFMPKPFSPAALLDLVTSLTGDPGERRSASG